MSPSKKTKPRPKAEKKKSSAKKTQKKPPVLAIDYGHVSAKCLLLKDLKAPPEFYEIPLGFSVTQPQLSVFENFFQVLQKVEELSGAQVFDEDFKKVRPRGLGVGPSMSLPILVSGELASLEFKKILAHRPIDPIDALKQLNLPLIDVRDSYTFVCGFNHREKVVVENILKWLPFEIDLSELENYLENKALYNQLVPTTPRDLHIEQAIAREKISRASDLRKQHFSKELQISEAVLTGAVFAKAPRPEQAVAIVLDSLEPQEPLKIVLDEKQWLPAVGTLGFYSEDLAAAALEKCSLKILGTALPVSASVKIMIDTGLGEAQELVVEDEGLVLFPLDAKTGAQVVVDEKSGKQSFKVSGGEVGLIIDSRPRPLELPRDNMERRRLLKEWGRELNTFGEVVEI